MRNFLSFISKFFIGASRESRFSESSLQVIDPKAEYIVLGEVIRITQDLDRDEVTIEVGKCLKGRTPTQGQLSFSLTPRDGLKNFDPDLKLGDSIVACLKEDNSENGEYYSGSISIFTNPDYQNDFAHMFNKTYARPTHPFTPENIAHRTAGDDKTNPSLDF